MRTIKIITPSGRVSIETNATTFGELREHPSFPAVDLTKNEVTVKGSDVSLRLDSAALPEGNVVMYITAKEQKAGMSKETYYDQLSTGELKDLCDERDIYYYSSNRESLIDLLLEDDLRENSSVSESKVEGIKNALLSIKTQIDGILDSIDDEDDEFDMKELERLSNAVKNIK
jgi:outer membrane protein assembly factor BamE (lipoprotein component of BamABCDE complex)